MDSSCEREDTHDAVRKQVRKLLGADSPVVLCSIEERLRALKAIDDAAADAAAAI